MPTKTKSEPPREIEGVVTGEDRWGNPIVDGEELRRSLAEYCKAEDGKACYCADCLETPAKGTPVRVRVNAKNFIVGWEENPATKAATAAPAAGPGPAPAPVALSADDRVRERRLAVLAAVAQNVAALDSVEALLRWSDTAFRWVESGELPRQTAPTPLRSNGGNGGNTAQNAVQTQERPLAARLAEDTDSAVEPASGGSDEPATVLDVLAYVEAHEIAPVAVFAALGIQSQSGFVLKSHIEGWINTARGKRSAGGALNLIRNAHEAD